MKLIIRNLGNYKKEVAIVILLLMIKAFCDLSMPQYTSDMIDTGIGSKGAEHILPSQMTEEAFEGTEEFMTEKEKEIFKSSYKKEDLIFIRKNKVDIEKTDEIFRIPFALAYQKRQGEKIGETERKKMEALSKTGGYRDIDRMAKIYTAICQEEGGIDMDRIQRNYLFRKGGEIFIMSLIMLLTGFGISALSAKVGADTGRNLRNRVFKKVMNYSEKEMNHYTEASLITRTTGDISSVEMSTMLIQRIAFYSPIVAIGGVYKIAKTGAGMGWLIGTGVALIVITIITLVKISAPEFKKSQTHVDSVNRLAREILIGTPVIRAFVREDEEEKRFRKANQDFMKNRLYTSRVMTFMRPTASFIMYFLIIIITWVSAKKVDAGLIEVGTMTAYIIYTMTIVMSFIGMSFLFIMLPKAGVSAERINEILKEEPSIKNPENPVKPNFDEREVLVFDSVSFGYGESVDLVLKDIDFVVNRGETIGIIGGTGSGKSTLVNLIPRLFDPREGNIRIFGTDIRDMKLETLRNLIGFVPQKSTLFSGTVESNLKFGNSEGTREELMQALDVSMALGFVNERYDGIESEISRGGDNFSGGEKQRLSVARAVAKKPEILILDDSFSALDMKTDIELRKALSEYAENMTVIIVSQRVSTVMDADCILVLEEGRIAASGTHDRLLQNSEIYRQIIQSQLSPGEQEMEGERL